MPQLPPEPGIPAGIRGTRFRPDAGRVPTPLIGCKTGSTLSVIGWCSGQGSGAP
jgi:hypothetical protein